MNEATEPAAVIEAVTPETAPTPAPFVPGVGEPATTPTPEPAGEAVPEPTPPRYTPLIEDELKALIAAKREQLRAHTEAHNAFSQQAQATLNESLKTALKMEGSIICLEELLHPKEEKPDA